MEAGRKQANKMRPWAGKQMQGHERTGRAKETWQALMSGILAGGNPVRKAFPGQVSEAMGFQIPHFPTAQLQASKYAPSTYWGPALCYGPEGKWSLLQGVHNLIEMTNTNIEFQYELFTYVC